MKKILLLCGVLASLITGSLPAFAATATHDFNSQVSLTSKCQVKTGTGTTLAFGTYTAFQSAALDATVLDIVFECTRDFSAVPNVEFNTGTDMTSSAAGSTATGVGVVAGLQYTLSVAAGALTAGTDASTSSTGTPDEYKFAVSGSIAGGQAGSCTTASCANATQARTLTITY